MKPTRTERPVALGVLIVAQIACAAFFLWDALDDRLTMGVADLASAHGLLEALAAVLLFAAVAVELGLLRGILLRKAHLERQASVAGLAFHDVMEARFRDWGLTPSEQDVATFLVKGMSIPEIAGLRGSAEGTVKSHLNGIYRKAGVTGRGGLLSLLIEDLFLRPYDAPSSMQVEPSAGLDT